MIDKDDHGSIERFNGLGQHGSTRPRNDYNADFYDQSSAAGASLSGAASEADGSNALEAEAQSFMQLFERERERTSDVSRKLQSIQNTVTMMMQHVDQQDVQLDQIIDHGVQATANVEVAKTEFVKARERTNAYQFYLMCWFLVAAFILLAMDAGFKVSDDKQWLFIPHVADPDSTLQAHFVRHGKSGYDAAVEYGFLNGVFTPGTSSPMLERNVAQLSYQERVVVKSGGPTISASDTTAVNANATFEDPALRQIYATYRFLFSSANTMNRYHTMNNPGLMDRLRMYSEAEPISTAVSSTMADKIAFVEPLLRDMRAQLDQVDLSVTPTSVLPNSGTCHHFTDHQKLIADDVEAAKIAGGSATRKGGWFKLDQLFVIRKADNIAAPVPYLDYNSGTQYFSYNEDRDAVESLLIFYGVLQTRFTPPVYTDSPPLPIGQRVETPPVGQYYREFPVPGYNTVNPDTRVRDNNMWQSEVAKYWYQKMWTYPQDYTYLWPEEMMGKERCSMEYLEKKVLAEMEDWDWANMVKRVKAPDANVITSERPTGFSNERKAVLRIVRRATNCFTPIAIPESRYGFGFSIGVAITIFHILDELASTAVGRRAAFSQSFLQRAKFQYRFNDRPLLENAIPELAEMHARATDLKSIRPIYSYRFAESTPPRTQTDSRPHKALQSSTGVATLLDFAPLEKTPLQLPDHEKQMRNCLLMNDQDVMNLRLAAEAKLFPMKRDVYMDSEVLDHMGSVGNLWQNAKALTDYKDRMAPTRITPSGYAETVFKPEEQAVLYSSEDMIISGVVDVLEMDADVLGSSIWRKELIYDDWRYRRLAGPGGRPQVIVYEKQTKTNYYPCSAIRKENFELVSRTWNHIDFEDGVANHVAHITATPSLRNSEILTICQSVQQYCRNASAQFAGVSACQAYLASLPMQDATCKARREEGSLSVQGDSLTCKWVQSRFLEFSPDDYCANMGASPPASSRCSATLCSSNTDVTGQASENANVEPADVTIASAPETCDTEKKSEIIVGTLTALPYCLPVLVGSGQCGANCTQAINSFLGKHVESGAMEVCGRSPLGIAETDGTGSLLLNLLQVNARTLIRRCAVSGSNVVRQPEVAENSPAEFELAPQYLFSATVGSGAMTRKLDSGSGGGETRSQGGNDQERGCDDPKLYMSEAGCRELNWQTIAQQMLDEWDGFQIHQRPRRTTIEAIAFHERSLFDTFLQPYFNYRTRSQVKAQLLKARNRLRSASAASSYTVAVDGDGSISGDMMKDAHYRDLYLDGELAHGSYRYEGMDRMHSDIIARGKSTSGAVAGFATLWRRSPSAVALETYSGADKTSFTRAFNATRELNGQLSQGIVEPEPFLRHQEISSRSRTSLHGSDLQDQIYNDFMPSLISLQNNSPGTTSMSAADREAVVDYLKARVNINIPEHVQKSFGYLLGASFAATVPALVRTLRRERKALIADRATALVSDQLQTGFVGWSLPTTHFAKQEAQTESMVATQIVNTMIEHQVGEGRAVITLTKELVEFLRENWCELGPPWVSTRYGHGYTHFKGTGKARILLEFLRTQASLVGSGRTEVLETVPRPGPLLGGTTAQNETTMVVRYDHAAHHLREDLFPDADKFDFTRDNLDQMWSFGIFEKDLGEYNTHLYSERYSLPADLELTDAPRTPQVKRQREVRTQRRCLGRNFALRMLFRTTDRFLPTDPTEAGICVPGNPNFVHGGVELMRQLIPVTTARRTYFVETFVHGKAVQKHAYAKNEFWTHFDSAKSDIAVDGSLFLFLNGNFPHAPQVWAKVVKHLHKIRPDATSVLINLPGYGKDATKLVDAGGSDCGVMGVASDILRDLIVSIKRSNTETWPRIFLVGDASPIGSALAWATADKLNGHPSDYLSGLISLAPHPELALKPLLSTADPGQIPFYSLLSPIIGEMALGLNHFASLKERVGDWVSALRPKHPHVLLIRAETANLQWSTQQWLGSFSLLRSAPALYRRLHTVPDASSEELFFSDRYASDVAEEVHTFAWSVRMMENPFLISVWKLATIPPALTGGPYLPSPDKDFAVAFAMVAAIVSVLGGLFLEREVGKVLVLLENRETYWRFGQVAMVPICLACMVSASWLGLPFFFSALFKFGFPEVTSLLASPWTRPGHARLDVYASFIDGIAFFIHHAGTSITYAAILGGLLSPYFLTSSLPLAMQHVAAPLKYVGHFAETVAYPGFLLLLEAWFQCEYFHSAPHISHWMPWLGLTMVLAAHWIWLLRGVLWVPLQWISNSFERRLERHEHLRNFDAETGEALIDPLTGLPLTEMVVAEGKKKKQPARGSVFMEAPLPGEGGDGGSADREATKSGGGSKSGGVLNRLRSMQPRFGLSLHTFKLRNERERTSRALCVNSVSRLAQ
eukprot:g13805.t1